MRARGRRRPGLRAGAALAVLGLVTAVGAPGAAAVDWDGRWWVGARVADYLPADEQKGGFRIAQEVFGARSARDVKPNEEFFGGLTLGRGLKRWDGNTTWRRFQLSVELEVFRLETSVARETGFRDKDGSTRLERLFGCAGLDDSNCIRFPAGDDDVSFETFAVGELELTPVFANALFHWGTERADFYAGAGLGVVLADITESPDYDEFTGTTDTVDVTVDDSIAANFKIGSNLRLTPNGNLFLFFEFQYFSTGLFGGSQVEWTGTQRGEENGFYLGNASYDTDDDGVLDRFGVPADLRVVDPGRVRVDGATAGLGLRYRFGGKKRAQADEAAGF